MNYTTFQALKKSSLVIALLAIAFAAAPSGMNHNLAQARADSNTHHTLNHVPAGASAAESSALALPSGFVDEVVIPGLVSPRTWAFAPDGRIFISEAGSDTSQDIRYNSIRVFKNGQLLPERALTLDLCANGERGLLGLAFDPDFETNRYLYMYSTRSIGENCRNQVSRYTVVGDKIDPASERVLIDYILSEVGVHNAGDLAFGPDGFLYVTTGDGGYSTLSPSTNNLNGKILRIKPQSGDAGGYLTTGNPFDSTPGAQTCGPNSYPFGPGPCREVYAYGLRNPWRFAFNTESGDLFAGDVGGGQCEEVNLILPGANYGHPSREGPCGTGAPAAPSGITDPIYAYSHENTPNGTAITGGAFYLGSKAGINYPMEYHHNYFLVDGFQGFIRRLAYNPATARWSPVSPDFATNAFGIIGLKAGPDGDLYYLTFDGSQ